MADRLKIVIVLRRAPVAHWIERDVADVEAGGSTPLRRARRVRIAANCTSFENSREQSLHRFESCTLRKWDKPHGFSKDNLAVVI
jgi:hypothetical protein